MIKSVCSLALSEIIVHVVKGIEWVHKDVLRGMIFVEYLLLERVAVFAVVDYNFAVACSYHPLVIRFKKWNSKSVDTWVYVAKSLYLYSEWVPLLDWDQVDEAIESSANNVVAWW